MRVARYIFASILVLVTPAAALAQAVANAQIHGVVTDSTGASVPGAIVKATQTETSQTVSTESNSSGSYVLPNLPVGPYTLQVSAPNFSLYTQSGIILQVANNVQVNIALQVGSLTQQVQVTADAAMVETQDTTISEVVDQRRIIDLPLNGRQATDLILLSGGATVAPNAAGRVATSHDYPTASPVSVSGGQENGNNYLLDGGDNNDSHSNVNLPFPMPDALQEFSVQTNGVPARYGLHPGAVINAVTKSGTNSIHGDLFEFVRNGDFNARNFFAATQDSLRRNQYGGTVGGPIRKDKLFIFGGFQATRERTAPPQTISYVNTQATLNGNFSAIESAACQSNGKGVQLIDPSNGMPFANNQIPGGRFSTPILNLAKLIPISSDPCGKLVYGIPSPNNENQFVGRMDWVQNAKHTFYGRYFITDYADPVYYTNNILTTTRSGLDERDQTLTFGDQYIFSPTVFNAVHATAARLFMNRSVSPNMPNPVALGANMTNVDPHFIDLTVTNFFAVGGGSNAPALFGRNQFQGADDLDIVRGRHHLSFGVDYMAIQMDINNISVANGEWTFNGSLSNSGLADFMLGRPSLLSQGNPNYIALRETYWGVYAQDDFQVAKNLSVHVGVRWEPSLPEHDIHNRGVNFNLANFIAGQKSTVFTNAPPGLLFYGDQGISPAITNGSYLDFAPRIGAAWDPRGDGKQSVRVSYGIFFDLPESYTDGDFATSSPWGSTVALTAPAGGFANPYLGITGGNPFPSPNPPPANATFSPGGTYITLPQNLHHMYMQQWNLSLERQLGGNWLASAAYLGNKATHLRTSDDGNPAVYIPGKSTVANTAQRRVLYLMNPTTGSYYSYVTTMNDGVNTNYNALRLSLQHRFAKHYTLLSVYTYSHCMQDSETLANRIALGSDYFQNPYNRNGDYGPCDSDLRHNLVNSVVAESPKFHNRAENWLLGNWSLSFNVTAHSGFVFNPTTGVDASLTAIGQDRPNVIGNPYVRNTNTLVWLNASAFVANAAGTYGNAGFNSLQGPSFFDMDANLSRYFPIRERQRVELRFEFFNILNNVNFANPVSNLHSAAFGQIQSASAGRILQFALKYVF
jgi:Carboxypeptidase regulatory-like domain